MTVPSRRTSYETEGPGGFESGYWYEAQEDASSSIKTVQALVLQEDNLLPHNLRLMRRRRDTGQVLSTCSLENSHG